MQQPATSNQQPATSNQQPAISIVFPVYNVEKYLSRCLYSLLDIKFDYEIIIVDDGSTDNSFSISENFQKRFSDKQITIIKKSNKGVSNARNVGLDIAKGKYVAFIDSDDFIDPLNFSKLIEQTISDDLEIGIGEFLLWNESGKIELISTEQKYLDRGITEGINLINVLKPNVWNNVYQRKFLNKHKIRFSEELQLGEDDAFYFHTMIVAKRVKNFPIPFYFYAIRSDNSSSAGNAKRYYNLYLLAHYTFALRELHGSKTMYDFVCVRAWWLLMVAFENLIHTDRAFVESKADECRHMLDICQNIESIPLPQREIMRSLLQEWNVGIFLEKFYR